MELCIILAYDWTCTICGKPNHSKTEPGIEYLHARCGHCHRVTWLDYHREADAPPAARQLDSILLQGKRSLQQTNGQRRTAYNLST